MPNKNYISGRKREYKIVHEAREKGCIAFRSAGSHSPIDVCIIDHHNKEIRLVQSKPRSMSDNARQKLWDMWEFLNGDYKVFFEVV